MGVQVYFAVFGVLIAATIAELLIIGQPLAAAVIVGSIITLAGMKAVLIALFYQHLKDEPRPLASLLLAGLVLAVILTTISFLQVH